MLGSRFQRRMHDSCHAITQPFLFSKTIRIAAFRMFRSFKPCRNFDASACNQRQLSPLSRHWPRHRVLLRANVRFAEFQLANFNRSEGRLWAESTNFVKPVCCHLLSNFANAALPLRVKSAIQTFDLRRPLYLQERNSKAQTSAK